MSDELEWLKSFRPPIAPASSETRHAALENLQRAIASDGETARGAPVDPGAAPQLGNQDHAPARSAGARSRRWRGTAERAGATGRRGPSLGAIASVLAAVGAIVIAGGALVLLRPGPHGSAGSNGRSGTRGAILDRSGILLATTQVTVDVQIDPSALPASQGDRDAVYRRLELTLGVSTDDRSCQIPGRGPARLAPIACDVAQQQAHQPVAIVTVATGTTLRIANQISRLKSELPGVKLVRVYRRRYPLGTLAAQLIGTVGAINPSQLHQTRYGGVAATAVIGQSGLESYYDSYLRAGDTLRLSLDARLQRAGQQALQHAIATNPPATGGAFVAMNPQNGEIYAMGSLPTFNENVFTRPITRTRYHGLFGALSGGPLFNRAIAGAGPVGATITPITAIAALQSGAWNVDQRFDDTGTFHQGALARHNPGGAVHGVITLTDAIKVFSDVFFYNLGALTNADPITHPDGGALQTWARASGIGQPTGIDVPGEVTGTIPTPSSRARLDQLERQCEQATGPFHGHSKRSNCGIADGRPWSIGDNINLAVGQGDIQLTPLQLADAYAAIANGGTIVRPHAGLDIESKTGAVQQRIQPPAVRQLNLNPAYLDAIRQGLRAGASQPGGTSADVFGNFPEPVYGTTGTAQYNNQHDYSWYAGYVPATATSTPIVVAVSVQQGGYGAHTAAPVARQILSQWFLGRKGPWQPGRARNL